ncbi:MAG: Rieske (2Fe-2S) protein [Candidatus Omnitrophota bacterium]
MVKTLIINLGQFSQIPVNEGTVFQVKGQPVVIFRSPMEKVYCYENKSLAADELVSDCVIKDDELVSKKTSFCFDLFTGEGNNNPMHLKVLNAWVEHGNVLIQYTPLYIHDGNIHSTLNN